MQLIVIYSLIGQWHFRQLILRHLVALVVVIFGLFALCAQQQHATAKSEDIAEKRDSSQRPSNAISTEADKNTTPNAKAVGQNSESKDEQEGIRIISIPALNVKPAKNWTDLVSLSFTGILVVVGIAATIVGILSLRAITRQTVATEGQTTAVVRQADANEEASRVAHRSTDAMINCERAWVVIRRPVAFPALRVGAAGDYSCVSGMGQFNSLTFAVINTGRTIARLTGPLLYKVNFLPATEHLPAIPKYWREPVSHDEVSGFILSPGETSSPIRLPIPDQITQETLASLDAGTNILYFYASLIYRDTFGMEREVRFGYLYRPKHE